MRMLVPMSSWSRPSRSSYDFFNDFDQIVDSFLQPTHIEAKSFQAACDVNETDDGFLVSFDMPGVKQEDINIEVKGQQLMISGERKRVHEGELRRERNYGEFERVFRLPETINSEKIEAHYQDGVLEVMIPKAEKVKGRSIEIQSGKSGFFGRLLGDKKSNTEIKDAKVS